MEGSGLMIGLQTSMECEGYMSIQIKTSEIAAFLRSFLLFSAKNLQMNGHIITGDFIIVHCMRLSS